MTIDAYYGMEGYMINVDDVQELYDALDIIHTQIMDNMPGENSLKLTKIISEAMDKLQAEYGDKLR